MAFFSAEVYALQLHSEASIMSSVSIWLFLLGNPMKDFDEYARSGALAAAVGKATRDAGLRAEALGLPPAGPVKVPTVVAKALANPTVRKLPAKVPSFIAKALANPPVRKSPSLSR